MTTFFLIAKASIKDILLALNWVLYIYYPVLFKKNKIRALIDFDNKIKAISLEYISKLGLKICFIDVRAQKIDNSTLKIFEIVLTSFQIKDKPG